jgi:predicted NBD/HSP70 family sugar kinase
MNGAKAVLAMDIGGTKTAVAVCDLGGRFLGQEEVATRAEEGGKAVLERAIAASRAVLSRAEGYELAAVGVSTIGVPLDNGVELAPAIPGWECIRLAHSVHDAFGAAVEVATDVKAAAAAEARWGSLVGADPAIYLNLGTGLGAAIVVNGRVVEGAHGAAGEIGYNVVDVAHVGQGIGARPMLEDTVSGMAVARAGGQVSTHIVNAKQVFEHAKDDTRLDGIVTGMLAALAPHLVNLTIAVDPVRVAVGGGMARSWDRLHGPLERALKSDVPYPPELVLAAYPFNAPLIGALALAAEQAGARFPDGPVLGSNTP